MLKGRIFDVAVDLRRRDAISVVSDQRGAPSKRSILPTAFST